MPPTQAAEPESIPELQRSLRMYKGLVEVSTLISSITDFDALLGAILDVAQRVMSAEASSLFLINDAGDLELAIARGTADVLTPGHRIVLPRGEGIAGWVLENRHTLLVPDAYADARFYREADLQSGFRTRSLVCAPLRRDGQEIGVLQVLNPSEKRAFEEADIEPFEAYAMLAATAIEKVRAIERTQAQQLVEQELSFAREVQNSFLPRALPEVPGLEFGAHYSPALNIGGDFYDVQQLGPDELYFAIGDVSGKGIPAALLMAQAVSAIRLILRPGLAPAEILRQGNRMLFASKVHGMFITAIIGRIVPSQRLVEFASAGHAAPESVPAALPMTRGGAPPLGVLPEIDPRPVHLALNAGDALAFYTDGLVESRDSRGRPFGLEGVRATLSRLLTGAPSSAAALARALVRSEAAHRGHAEPHDDLTLLTIGFPRSPRS